MIFLQLNARAMRKNLLLVPYFPMRREEGTLVLHLGRSRERPREVQRFQTTVLTPEVHRVSPGIGK